MTDQERTLTREEAEAELDRIEAEAAKAQARPVEVEVDLPQDPELPELTAEEEAIERIHFETWAAMEYGAQAVRREGDVYASWNATCSWAGFKAGIARERRRTR